MSVHADQEKRLRDMVGWARKLRATLEDLQTANAHRVHFRPGSSGVAMVGLLAERPQRGKSGLTNLNRVVLEFEALFAANCQDIEHGRVTGEKKLQSFLIRQAYAHGGLLVPINTASETSNDPVHLRFITDEIALPLEAGNIVCDILALRCDGGRSTPVLLELKDARQLKRLIEQVEGYSRLMNQHASLFAELFAALLGDPVHFDGPTEKWIVWPIAGKEQDPQEDKLASCGIRVVGYEADESDGYHFRVGKSVGTA